MVARPANIGFAACCRAWRVQRIAHQDIHGHQTGICGTDVHILKGKYPVAKGLTIGHEPVGVIEKLGSAAKGYQEG